MNYFKRALYVTISLIGLITIVGGLFPIYIETYLLPDKLIIISSKWAIIIGFIFASVGLLLLTQKYYVHEVPFNQYSVAEILLVSILIFSVVFTIGWFYGQYDHTRAMSTQNIEKMREQLMMLDNMEKSNPFYSKKVIVRDDDVGNFSSIQSVRWLSNLCTEKDIKVTYAVIPTEIISSPETINYLNTLDRDHFEFAVHGYEHTSFKGLPYYEQHSQIKNSTEIIENDLNYRPVTFVPPSGSGDINTTKACKFLGYHSITDVIGYPSYVMDFTSDFEWEKNYEPVVSQHKFEDLKNSFDGFYNSSDEYYIVYLHDWTFLDRSYKLDKEKTGEFEKAIDYVKTTNAQFFTIEDAYRWQVDEPNIRTFKIDKSNYSIDLMECRYNHTIKFSSPLNVTEPIIVTDMNTNDKITFHREVFEFNGTKGHWYIVSI